MFTVPQNNWHKIADNKAEISFSASGLAEVSANGKTICIGKAADVLFACAQKCPHAGGHLADGYIDSRGNITCPLHRYKFDPQSGRNISGEGYFLRTFPIEIRPDGIYVSIP